MNTGIQDAWNLAWKLALVVKGQAAEELLESYELERIPVAKAVLNGSDKGFSFIGSPNYVFHTAPQCPPAAPHQPRFTRKCWQGHLQVSLADLD